MRTYKIVRKKAFESEGKFEARINELASRGWKATTMTMYGGLTILMEKE